MGVTLLMLDFLINSLRAIYLFVHDEQLPTGAAWMTTPTASLPSLDLLQVFVRGAELSSCSRAADDLGRPKASISAAVQRLESQLGTRLLHRTTRRVELSQDGQACYERAKDLLADVEELQALFQRAPQALRGRLRIDLPVGIARGYVIPRLPEFLGRHPELTLEVSSTDRRVDLVREGFDCVLRIGALGDSGLVARPLGELPQVNCASPAYLQRHGTPQSLDDLAAGHRLVHYVGVLGARPVGWEHGRGDGYRTLAMDGSITVNNSDAYEAACLAGLGIIQAPAIGMRAHLAAGRLVEVLPQFTAPPLPVSLVYAHRRQLPLRVQAVMGWIAEVLAPHLQPANGPMP